MASLPFNVRGIFTLTYTVLSSEIMRKLIGEILAIDAEPFGWEFAAVLFEFRLEAGTQT